MIHRIALVAGVAAFIAAAPSFAQDRSDVLARDLKALADMLPDIWDNQEQVYFSETTGETGERLALRIDRREDGAFDAVRVNDEGRPLAGTGSSFALAVSAQDNAIRQTISKAEGQETCAVLWRREAEHFVAEPDGACADEINGLATARLITGHSLTLGTARLRKARPFACWIAVPKQTGDNQWHFEQSRAIHDQGGRIWVTTDEPEPQRVGLKMRNVVWPSGRNRNSLVLYIYRGEETRSIAYTWTEPEGTRLAINLRWMQASCTLADDLPEL